MFAMHHNEMWEAFRGALAGGGMLWILSTAVRNLPVPLDSERWYQWIYSTLQAVAANHDLWGKK